MIEWKDSLQKTVNMFNNLQSSMTVESLDQSKFDGRKTLIRMEQIVVINFNSYGGFSGKKRSLAETFSVLRPSECKLLGEMFPVICQCFFFSA